MFESKYIISAANYFTGSEPKPDWEFNVWTKPDCGGTTFENGNRYVNLRIVILGFEPCWENMPES